MRMLERKRLAKHYQIVPGDDETDLELGEGVGAQESGTVSATAVVAPTLDQEVDNWDENLEDNWDDDHALGADNATESEGLKTPSASSAGDGEEHKEHKKRAD